MAKWKTQYFTISFFSFSFAAITQFPTFLYLRQYLFVFRVIITNCLSVNTDWVCVSPCKAYLLCNFYSDHFFIAHIFMLDTTFFYVFITFFDPRNFTHPRDFVFFWKVKNLFAIIFGFILLMYTSKSTLFVFVNAVDVLSNSCITHFIWFEVVKELSWSLF